MGIQNQSEKSLCRSKSLVQLQQCPELSVARSTFKTKEIPRNEVKITSVLISFHTPESTPTFAILCQLTESPLYSQDQSRSNIQKHLPTKEKILSIATKVWNVQKQNLA